MDDDAAASTMTPPLSAPSKQIPLDDISTSESEPEIEDEADEKPSPRSPAGSPEPAPEVRCMWEDCGETFNDLQPFIAHLHSCTCSCLFFLHLGRHGPVQSFSDRVTYINSSYWNPQIALCV